MASSEVEISNRALGRIGIDQLIESLDDPNNRARQSRLHYEPCRDEVLQDFPWNFAQACVALALVSNVEVPGWRYVYRYPNNAVKVHRVTGPEGQRIQDMGRWTCEVWNYDVLLPNKQPFSVMNDPVNVGAKIIISDLEMAYAWYTTLISDASQFSPLFRSALSWRMAMELALALRANTALYNNAATQYGWSVSQGQVASLGEQTPDREPMSPSVRARY